MSGPGRIPLRTSSLFLSLPPLVSSPLSLSQFLSVARNSRARDAAQHGAARLNARVRLKSNNQLKLREPQRTIVIINNFITQRQAGRAFKYYISINGRTGERTKVGYARGKTRKKKERERYIISSLFFFFSFRTYLVTHCIRYSERKGERGREKKIKKERQIERELESCYRYIRYA